jgi:hypothetical protein
VAAPEGPSFRSFSRARPTRPPGGGTVFAVGRRVLVVNPTGRSERVALTAADGTSPSGTVATGTEVEIVAWQPYRAGGARYRVASAREGIEGWLPAAHLRAVPIAAPAKVVVKVAPPPPPPPPAAASPRVRKPAAAATHGGRKVARRTAKSKKS